ncbi:MAG: hypothetical protein JRJ76_13070 [Deltaproteobacteria bacterium]|nr:hypothetical protein [Deltaproteobacteria bacterium]MBW1848854.1 hypothetical protein [Deltaproteobacteria bacterium]MBW2180232.1 hypothetical protein [Deltaproteobacteria bacterium]MBW2365526.1 hypothetical protein [Deltaproteobacteria bacterium]
MKNLFNIFVISLCIVLGVSFAYAVEGKTFAKNNDSTKSTAVKGPNFVDKDGDEICDNIGGKGKGGGKGKRYRRGARDGSGPNNSSNKRGPNFVDKNSDGICDNRAEKGSKK